MSRPKIKRALLSVYDKTGIVELARTLTEQFGIEIISTGGTANLLTESGIPVTSVDQVTGFPEMMDGRVKTLHPNIHAAILADRDNPEHMRQLESQNIKPIDMIVVNLYPFEKTIADADCTFEQAIEMIDIGGPCMLRAAAKNHKHVLVVASPDRYDAMTQALNNSDTNFDELAIAGAKYVFDLTAGYDRSIAAWLADHNSAASHDIQAARTIDLCDRGVLRYGENPHQTARLFSLLGSTEGVNLTITQPAGESSIPMSFNNYIDANAAWQLCEELHRRSGSAKSCVFIKHMNACGVGYSDSPIEAYKKAYLGDPNAAMGGILACDFDIDIDMAQAVMQTYDTWGKAAGAGGFFVEVWVAPNFDKQAIELIRDKKKWGQRVRLLPVGDLTSTATEKNSDLKAMAGGMLIQSPDNVGLNEDQWKIVTKRQPSDREMADLRLAWLTCKHTKSNAISVCKDNMLIGNGAGQMSRVMSCRIAVWLAKENGHDASLAGAVAASDAFFPFADGPNILIDAGVSAIIEPGGSKRDAEVIDACNNHNITMIFTSTRHFKH